MYARYTAKYRVFVKSSLSVSLWPVPSLRETIVTCTFVLFTTDDARRLFARTIRGAKKPDQSWTKRLRALSLKIHTRQRSVFCLKFLQRATLTPASKIHARRWRCYPISPFNEGALQRLFLSRLTSLASTLSRSHPRSDEELSKRN